VQSDPLGLDAEAVAIMKRLSAVQPGEPMPSGPSTAAPTAGHAPAVAEPDPQWLHAEGVTAREVLAFDTGRDIGKRGLQRFSAEMLEADAAVLRNVRSEQDADNIHAELLRGFDVGRDECGNAPTNPPKGAGKVEAKYRNPEDGATWSGRGLKPRWLVAEMEAGRSMDEFLIPA
jgi:DNA-binding protein H-NS